MPDPDDRDQPLAPLAPLAPLDPVAPCATGDDAEQPSATNHDSERGSGTVLMVGVVAVVLVLVGALGSLSGAQRARGAAQAAADLAALAAASRAAAPLGVDDAAPGDSGACALAVEVATRNGARVTACEVRDGGVVDIDTAVSSTVGTAHAEARAGPAGAREHEPGAG